jgi:hypothetical protein
VPTASTDTVFDIKTSPYFTFVEVDESWGTSTQLVKYNTSRSVKVIV